MTESPTIEDLSLACIHCGFCLEACPTFSETGDERQSPRGRIYLVRSAIEGKLRWVEDVLPHLSSCLGCRACETACPSGVEYGQILELARSRIEIERPAWPKRRLLEGMTNPWLLRTQLTMAKLWPSRRLPGFVSRLLSGAPAELDLPSVEPKVLWPALGEGDMPPVRGEVYLLEGCAMRVLFPTAHDATRRLIRRVGFRVRDVPQGCCGALHAHNGYLDKAQQMAARLASEFPGDLPVVVNSAGCGSTMKEYADPGFAARVTDVSEFLSANGLAEVLAAGPAFPIRVTYHDACHLAHGQGVRNLPRQLLRTIPGVEYVELGEADTCCGSAGIYNVTQPAMARRLLDRKWEHVAATGASIVATGNPGCHAWIAQAAREHGAHVHVMHTAEVLERALSGVG